MDPRLSALRRLLADPAANATLLAVGVAVIVTFVLLVTSLLIAAALPPTPRRASTRTTHKARLVSWLIIVSGIIAASVLWYDGTSSDTYCARTCHTMTPAAASWNESAHANVACVRCHERQGVKSIPYNLAVRTRCLMLEITRSDAKRLGVPEQRCLDCHTGLGTARIEGRDGEVFTHAEVWTNRSCESCHGVQGHVPAGE